MGFRLNLRLGFSIQFPHFSSSSSSWPPSHSCWEFSSERASCPSVILGENETSCSNRLIVHNSAASQTLEMYTGTEERKMDVLKRSCRCPYNILDDHDICTPGGEHHLAFLTSLQATKTSQTSSLMENLDTLEKTFTDSDVIRLKQDILAQLERIGALKLFYACLSRILKSPTFLDFSDLPAELNEEPHLNDEVKLHTSKIIVHSGRKKERESRRKKALHKSNDTHGVALPSKAISKHPHQHKFAHRTMHRRLVARNEANLSGGVKLVAALEKIRMILEEETGQVATFSDWAEAAGVEKKDLQRHLHYGWQCRDKLLRSTQSLVVFLSRNYRGLGVAFEDLVQAGNLGVLQGAERFDENKGVQFSTYVQYWIRKSMSSLVAQHARGIRIPVMLSKAINKIQKARKALISNQKYPEDIEIAKLTGLSIAKVISAGKCLRVVGSIDQKMGDSLSARFLELTPDTSVTSPEQTVMKEHMVNEIYRNLKCLEPRERQVLILRFGLGDHQLKSLEEIGRVFGVSKEWIRKIERKALTKLRDEENIENLRHYLYNR